MKNLGQIMKQAQEMQGRMNELQEKLQEMEITGQSGGGLVQVTLTGKGEAKKVKIDPSLIDPNDSEVLEDLLLAAINDARGKVDAEAQEQMKELTGGMNLPPGMNLPF
ncbi:YbaB/EbfC family nucleoid-associated protein [Fodinicurvata fenggangensis]|uniref:YbaB/EbfC family nucleoid-associated protein n=1 Tax=Fodinicurvata fenggangensis TaxID=1121830 RepID=UPI00047D7C1D|nr:YbaB/EbfC family nucleoid-associated protein [Fodinicurvata fenggangensis]